jgi:hypothetical protein
MKSNRTIEIIVQPSGEILIDAVGFKGADCERATAFLEEALGPAASRNRKPEYLQAHHTAQRQQRLGTP